jgi:hypothetical protein
MPVTLGGEGDNTAEVSWYVENLVAARKVEQAYAPIGPGYPQ